jgi:hypothetical protein
MKSAIGDIDLIALESLVDKVISMRAANERTVVALSRKRRLVTVRGLLALICLCAIISSFFRSVHFFAITYLYNEQRGHRIYAARVESSLGSLEYSDGYGTNKYRFFGIINR